MLEALGYKSTGCLATTACSSLHSSENEGKMIDGESTSGGNAFQCDYIPFLMRR